MRIIVGEDKLLTVDREDREDIHYLPGSTSLGSQGSSISSNSNVGSGKRRVYLSPDESNSGIAFMYVVWCASTNCN